MDTNRRAQCDLIGQYAMVEYKSMVCGGQQPSWVRLMHGMYLASGLSSNIGRSTPPIYLTTTTPMTDDC